MTRKLFSAFILSLLFIVQAHSATQTINTVPSATSSFMTDLQTFLEDEAANRDSTKGNLDDVKVVSGGIGPTDASLTHTITTCEAFPNGFYVSQASVSHTYTATKRTYVYLRDSDSRTITIGGAAITYDGHFVFAEMATAAAQPTTPTGCLTLFYADTNAAAITTITDQREITTVYYPDHRAIDHGATGDSNTVKYYVDLIGTTNRATVKLRAQSGVQWTDYVFATNDDYSSNTNITFEFERGARFAPNSGVTLVLPRSCLTAGHEQILAGDGNYTFATGTYLLSSWFADFETAITKISSAVVTLEVDEPSTIAADCTVNANTSLLWKNPGNLLTVATTKNLTVAGPVFAAPFQLWLATNDGSAGDVIWISQSLLLAEYWGVSPTASAAENGARLQAAIVSAATAGHIKIASYGTISYDTTLDFSNEDLTFEASSWKTTLSYTGAAEAIHVYDVSDYRPVTLKNFRLVDAGTATDGIKIGKTTGTSTQNNANVVLEHLWIASFDEMGAKGINVVRTVSSHFVDLLIHGCYDALYMDGSTTSTLIERSRFGSSTRYGAYLIDSQVSIKFDTNVFESNGADGLRFAPAAAAGNTLTMTGNHFEGNNTTTAGSQCYLKGVSGFPIYRTTFTNNIFQGDASWMDANFRADYCTALTIESNSFDVGTPTTADVIIASSCTDLRTAKNDANADWQDENGNALASMREGIGVRYATRRRALGINNTGVGTFNFDVNADYIAIELADDVSPAELIFSESSLGGEAGGKRHGFFRAWAGGDDGTNPVLVYLNGYLCLDPGGTGCTLTVFDSNNVEVKTGLPTVGAGANQVTDGQLGIGVYEDTTGKLAVCNRLGTDSDPLVVRMIWER